MGVAENGMVVGHTAVEGNYFVHGFTWTLQTGMVDLGTLAGLGYGFSLASSVNKGGTLIVGWSSSEYAGIDMLPVVWTPEDRPRNGKFNNSIEQGLSKRLTGGHGS